MIRDDIARLRDGLPETERAHAARYRKMIARFRARWFEQDSFDENGRTTWKLNDDALKHQQGLGKPIKSFDQGEQDLGQLHGTIAELTKELKEVKEVLKSNEKLLTATRRLALASLDVAANATQKPNEDQKRVLEEHDVYTPVTRRTRKAKEAGENASALDAFGSLDCDDFFP